MELDIAHEKNRAKVHQFQQKHRVGLLTLLFTDLVGSTKLKQELGDKTAVALMQRHHSLAREILAQYQEGEEISTSGDSFFIVFAKPSDAVQFSLRLQSRLRELSRSANHALFDRIGIHIGEVIVENTPDLPKTKDLYGLQVDICARVMSLAEGDQILMTRSVFDNARQVLKGLEIDRINEVSWLNHGPYLLKGVEEPLEICEVGEMGAAVLKPPPDSEKVRRYASPDAEPVSGWRPAVDQKVPGTEWQLEAKLGEGGFGEVWLGAHSKLKEKRVFKFCFRAERVRALKREVTLFRLLKERIGEHANIVRLLDVFFDEPPFYIVEEYVPGKDLKTWSNERGGVERLPLEIKLEIVAQAAEALQAAHDAGVIHRDIKPGNILIAECGARSEQPATPSSALRNPFPIAVKLTDFGIGQVTSHEVLASVTRLGFTQTMVSLGSSSHAGTQLYMAPELFAGKTASTQSDIYSLGVVLYQLLAGDFSQPVTVDWRRKAGDPLLQEDLDRCFAGDPQERFADAAALAKSIRSLRAREAQRCAREKAARRHRRVLFAAGASAISALMVLLFLLFGKFATDDSETQLVVLPFAHEGPSETEEHLSSALMGEIIDRFARARGIRAMMLPGHMASMPIEQLRLDLAHLNWMMTLESTLQGAGPDRKLILRLVSTADGGEFWSGRVDAGITNLATTPGAAALQVISALNVRLTSSERRRIEGTATENSEAYNNYLKGRFFWNQRTESGFKLALDYFNRTIEIDPGCAAAYAGIASTYVLLGHELFCLMQPDNAHPKAKAAARKALELDETLAEAHSVLGESHLRYDWDWAAADREHRRAIELNPNYATGHQWYSHYLLPMGRVSESLAASRRALELDPLSMIINVHLGWHYLYAGDCDRAIAQLEKTLKRDVNFALARLFLGQAYEQKGKSQEAILQFQQSMRLSRQNPVHVTALAHAYAISGQTAEAEQLLDELKLASKQRFVPSYEIAVVYAGLNKKEQALDWLEKAFEQRDSGWLVDSALDPRLASLRSHPRFIQLLKKMRMPSI